MKNSQLVYSTESGKICPECKQSILKCTCRKKKAKKASGPFPDDGVARICREVKGRGGKTVTSIFGIPLEGADLKSLAKELKQSCGAGGSVKNGVVIIQGDHRENLVDELQKRGYTAKIAGG